MIKHYRMRKMENGGVYISPKRTFDNIMDLVEHYRSKINFCIFLFCIFCSQNELKNIYYDLIFLHKIIFCNHLINEEAKRTSEDKFYTNISKLIST